jgi:hypothetical protein
VELSWPLVDIFWPQMEIYLQSFDLFLIWDNFLDYLEYFTAFSTKSLPQRTFHDGIKFFLPDFRQY